MDLTSYTEARMPSEQKWYALTGRIVDAKVEADGDIHIALVDASGNNAGTVSAEIPVGPKWCEIRQTIFGWTTQKFPFTIRSKVATIQQRPAVHEGRHKPSQGWCTGSTPVRAVFFL
jgi:hypothetical protein